MLLDIQTKMTKYFSFISKTFRSMKKIIQISGSQPFLAHIWMTFEKNF